MDQNQKFALSLGLLCLLGFGLLAFWTFRMALGPQAHQYGALCVLPLMFGYVPLMGAAHLFAECRPFRT